MDEHLDILLPVLSWVWLALVGVMVWFFRKIGNIQDDIAERRGVVNTAVAVLETSQESLRKEFEKDSERNNADHQKIIERIETLDGRVMTRLDSLLKIAKNGR